MAMSFLVSLSATLLMDVRYSLPSVVMSIVAILPAGIDFTLEELVKSYPASNALRFSTGLFFGAGAGVCVYYRISSHAWLPVVLFLACAAAMQFSIAILFRIFGHLEEYIAKYVDAVQY